MDWVALNITDQHLKFSLPVNPVTQRLVLPERLSRTRENPICHPAGSPLQPPHDVGQRDPGILPPDRAGVKTAEWLVSRTKPNVSAFPAAQMSGLGADMDRGRPQKTMVCPTGGQGEN